MKRFAVCLLVLMACAVVVAVSSTPAYAVDGVVLINQNTSVSGLPGCGSGFPIIICQSGSYRLSGNLVVPGRANGAIDITADDVTLDLNGFAISGPITCSGSPPTCTGLSGNGICSHNYGTGKDMNNEVVRNGVVQGFLHGVVLNGNNNTVEEIRATGNFFNGIFVNDALVRRNTASLNGAVGIHASDSTVTENTANSNGAYGLSISTGIYGSNTFSLNSVGPVLNFGGGYLRGTTTAGRLRPAECLRRTLVANAFPISRNRTVSK